MITPQFTITVDDRRITLHLEKLSARLKTNLRTAITDLTETLLIRVRAAEPSRTGQLRLQTRAFLDEGETFIRGRVRVLGTAGQPHNIAAAALEYGAHRTVSVRPYLRESVLVRAYQRQADITARKFLRGPAEAMRERALAELQKAVDKSVDEAAR